jgi:hypothetical protein
MLNNIRTSIRQLLHIGPTPHQQHFDAIMDLALKVEQINPEGLVSLVRLLGRRMQAQCMSDAALTFQTDDLPNIEPATVLFSEAMLLTPTAQCVGDLLQRRNKHRTVQLAQDIILPWPWNCWRLANALAKIGPGRAWGPWQYDPTNHYVQVWEPMGICWVGGGNHSITAGILQGTGSIPAEEVFDMSAVYPHLSCDGEHFTRRCDNKVVAKVSSIECAAIFEIGRRMLDHGLSA